MKLGLLTNMAVGIPIAILGALIGTRFFAPAAQTAGTFYIYGCLLIVQAYVIGALDPVVAIRKTHVLGYAYAIYEIIRVAGIYILLVVFNVGIAGAITSLILANLGWLAVYVVAVGKLWSENPNLSHLRQWISGSFLNTYIVGANALTTLEGLIIILIAGPIAAGDYAATVAVSIPIAYTAALSTALYPKILAGGTGDDVESAWKITLLFSLPLTISVISLSSSLLAILGGGYVPVYIVLSVVAVRYFIASFNPIFDAIVTGTERMDEEGFISFSGSLRSRLIFSPTAIYITYIIYLPALWILLPKFTPDPVMVALATSMIGLPANIAVTTAKFLIARRYMNFSFPFASALKFGFIGGVLALAVPILNALSLITLPMRPITTVALFVLGGAVYFFILYFIEDEARNLIDTILTRLRLAVRSLPLLGRVTAR